MTEKRFTVPENYRCIQDNLTKEHYLCEDKTEAINLTYLLNKLAEENIELHIQLDFLKDENRHMKSVLKENKELKSILQDMGLIMSNEEVKNVRDEIASKLIKPVCKGNGFDVDVDTENGFTIIPKEDFE